MGIFKKARIFLDYAGGERNPSAIHKEGRLAKKALEEARLRLSRLLMCQAKDIVFTSGGTEADNLAILGVVEKAKAKIGHPHVLISSLEHPAVYESAKKLLAWGVEVTIVEPEDGVINPQTVLKNIRENTVLVSIVYGVSETGNINPVPKIARLIKDFRKKRGTEFPYVHTDASQAYEFLPVDIGRLPTDLITLDGVLVVRPNVSISPVIVGGGQERGLRAGTQDVLGIERFVKSFEKSLKEQDSLTKKLNKLKRLFIEEIKTHLPEAKINTRESSLPNIVSITFEGLLHEFIAIKLDEMGVAVSTGSACDSSKNERDKDALRFSFGPKTKESEIKKVIRILRGIVI
jgi:Cysteine sulfinate desulfinase/cysteine desulfurase and related enzymes